MQTSLALDFLECTFKNRLLLKVHLSLITSQEVSNHWYPYWVWALHFTQRGYIHSHLSHTSGDSDLGLPTTGAGNVSAVRLLACWPAAVTQANEKMLLIQQAWQFNSIRKWRWTVQRKQERIQFWWLLCPIDPNFFAQIFISMIKYIFCSAK